MKRMVRFISGILFSAVIIAGAQSIPAPEDVFGFQMGTDRKLIHWEQIVSYFRMLDESSPRIKVVELGHSTLNRPMILALISTAETLQNLDKYKRIQSQLGRPFHLSEAGAESLIKEGKLVFLITLNIHSTEIASSQESVELAYELVTSREPRVRKILENVIVLLVPSLNPDGQDMVSKWYLKYVGTPYEGSRMPMKYHRYADHDNNRDWFFFNLVESRHVARVLYHDWYPEIVLDQHQMGSSSARLFLPPYADPVNPNVPPALMASVNMVGKHVVADMHHQGFTGLVTGTIFNAYFEGTMSKTPLWHNRIGILTEAASVRIATPLFFSRTSLKGMGLDLPEYKQQTNFLAPWPGGWWRLRDIIEYEKAATYSMLELAATYREKFKRQFYQLNRQAIEQGRKGNPFAFVIPIQQHDPSNVIELLRRLRIANVNVYQAQEDFQTPEGIFHKGDFIVPLAQPGRAYIKDLMERQSYPDLREYPGGPPRRPYDVTAWTLPLQMGVSAVEVATPFTVAMKVVEPAFPVNNDGLKAQWAYAERRFTNSYKLVNSLLKKGVEIYQLEETTETFAKGSFIIKMEPAKMKFVQEESQQYEVPIQEFSQKTGLKIRRLHLARIGIYQPWIPWSYDEGWLRLVFDEFGFDYRILHNADFRDKKSMNQDLDILIFGSQWTDGIVEGKRKKAKGPKIADPRLPIQYRGGIGHQGVEKVKQFLLNGGTTIFLGESCDFAIEKLKLPATNVLKEVPRKEFFAPGSIVRVNLDKNSPLTWGMPDRAAIYLNQPIALTLEPYPGEVTEVGFYEKRDLLLSGWVVGEEKLHGKVALAEIPVEKGRAILYAFRVQHRGQTYGTFKLLFNALYKLGERIDIDHISRRNNKNGND